MFHKQNRVASVDGNLNLTDNTNENIPLMNNGNQDMSMAKIVDDNAVYKMKENDDTESDEENIEDLKEVFWKSSLGIGSKFMTCSLRSDKDLSSDDIRDEDNSPISFYRDKNGRLVGSFFVYSRIPEGNNDVLAYHVFTSSKISFKMFP